MNDRDPLRQECARLRAENERLKESTNRVKAAKRYFSWDLKLTPRQQYFLWQIYQSYPDAAGFMTRNSQMCAVFHVRKKLKLHGIELITSYGYGYRLDKDNYERLREFR